jgi:NDP-sugar pyrophosphorylase family protein
MQMIDELAADGVLFVIDENNELYGSLSDGDIRRGILDGLNLDNAISDFCERTPKVLIKDNFIISDIIELRENKFEIIPIIDHKNQVVDVLNFRLFQSYLPIDVVIMAGGRGQRLSPLTDTIPKPLLKVGEKPIIEHNIDRLIDYGVKNIWITIKYLGDQIISYFGDGASKTINIQYEIETEALGTVGAVSKIKGLSHEYLLITNSDLLTNIDYEDFFCTLLDSKADICIATVPYTVDIPYAILETDGNKIINLKEKPSNMYLANAGIYLMKRSVIELIPKDNFYNATDLVEKCIANGLIVQSYLIHGYWLDIGKIEDYNKAQHDIKHIKI